MSKKLVRMFVVLVGFCCIIPIAFITRGLREKQYTPYNEVLLYIKEDKVSSIIAREKSSRIEIVLNDGTKKTARVPSIESLSLILFEEIQNGSNIHFKIKSNKTDYVVPVLLWILQLFLFGFLVFKFRKIPKCQKNDEWISAIHEAGHAIIGYIIAPEIQIIGISIIPDKESNGRVVYNNEMFENITTQKKIQILYAGKIATECILHKKADCYGYYGDFKRATRYVYNDIVDNSLLIELPEKKEFNAHLLLYQIETMHNICKEEYNKVQELVNAHKKQIKELAEIIFKNKKLSQEEVKTYMKGRLKK